MFTDNEKTGILGGRRVEGSIPSYGLSCTFGAGQGNASLQTKFAIWALFQLTYESARAEADAWSTYVAGGSPLKGDPRIISIEKGAFYAIRLRNGQVLMASVAVTATTTASQITPKEELAVQEALKGAFARSRRR